MERCSKCGQEIKISADMLKVMRRKLNLMNMKGSEVMAIIAKIGESDNSEIESLLCDIESQLDDISGSIDEVLSAIGSIANELGYCSGGNG
jgi:hypothetical protein